MVDQAASRVNRPDGPSLRAHRPRARHRDAL